MKKETLTKGVGRGAETPALLQGHISKDLTIVNEASQKLQGTK